MKDINAVNQIIKCEAEKIKKTEYGHFLNGVIVSWNKNLYSAFGRAWTFKGKIEFSIPLLLCDEIAEKDIIDTIRHEIAHVIADRKTGQRQGHNDIWRSIALSIGCNGIRCGKHVNVYKYDVICEVHGKIGSRNSRRKNSLCRLCYYKENSQRYVKYVKREEKGI